MRAAFLGPSHTNEEIGAWLEENSYPCHALGENDLQETVARAVADEKVVGMLQGRMEFGPRSLGNRSILADARSTKMQSYLNLATKFRESFRPFAPICLEEDAGEYFEFLKYSPYMLLVDEVRRERCVASSARERCVGLKEWVNEPRSDMPAITHVDYSARVQTVNEEQNPRIFGILHELKRLTGFSIMVNTSFNVRSEPIVCTPEDAYRCFMRTGIDVLVLENAVLWKTEQPKWAERENWREDFGLD